jgi:hypothetical protein
MTRSDRDILADIERNEQWLREHAAAHPQPLSVEHLKLRVRIAADEEWLRQYPSPKPAGECLRRVRQAVRTESERKGVRNLLSYGKIAVLDEIRRDPLEKKIPDPFFAADLPSRVASLAAAAVLVFAVVIGLLPPRSAATPSAALEDFVEVCAADGQDRWGLEPLRDAVDDLETQLSEPYWPQRDLYDDVDDDVRDLMDDLGSPPETRGNPT